jgi:hypothetical protein
LIFFATPGIMNAVGSSNEFATSVPLELNLSASIAVFPTTGLRAAPFYLDPESDQRVVSSSSRGLSQWAENFTWAT